MLQDTVRFVFGHRGHNDPEVYSLEQLLPARWGRGGVSKTGSTTAQVALHC